MKPPLIIPSRLRPCPFCGGAVIRVTGIVYDLNFFKCTNPDCGATMSFDNDYSNTHTDEAIRQYNTRAPDA